ncbi:hypothetical protein XELAEV_18032189mg [Xenopus laevis]|uniref:Uncharacterized protein n=1 Tax=Xenopus laevis TaxID=8355 RepID=A0A974CQL9_XENLA|nr:hypothetical protein XELAEV_18032189mg [Xenopus laevis]
MVLLSKSSYLWVIIQSMHLYLQPCLLYSMKYESKVNQPKGDLGALVLCYFTFCIVYRVGTYLFVEKAVVVKKKQLY